MINLAEERNRMKIKQTQSAHIQINMQAMDKMSALHDALKGYGYQGHDLEMYLVRLLFCLFAEDTAIFPAWCFYDYIAASKGDGSDLSLRLSELFFALHASDEERCLLSEEAGAFPYINGPLFEESLPVLPFDRAFYLLLLTCHETPWRKISPAIFGAMFQEIMNQQKRREWGTYYTSEENILKLVRPLILDELWEAYNQAIGNKRRLQHLHERLRRLRFFDPACGCGNFLIITYRELRHLEMAIIRELYGTSQRVLDVGMYFQVHVDQFYGIEIEPFQAQIACVGMWLMDHQLNLEAAETYGMYYAKTPLLHSAEIFQGNALTTDWKLILQPEEDTYIIGNPPFVGARLMNTEQKKDMRLVFNGSKTVGNMDYVTAWYKKAAAYMAGTSARAAFVSTNSICQGEQAALLWKNLKYQYHAGIDFAYQTFVWNNEAKGQAKVHCVIIGFSDWPEMGGRSFKRLFSGEEEWHVPHINAYLAPAPDVFVEHRRKPLTEVPPMLFGSMANDGGRLLLEKDEAAELLDRYPALMPVIRPFLGASEYIKGGERYCLWFRGADLTRYTEIPEIRKRLDSTRRFREDSPREATRKLAATPELFGEIRQPEDGRYVLVPRVSSCRRPYIPIGFVPASVIASDAVLIVPEATAYLFGVLTSAIHMAWVEAVAGRLKSDYRYSASIVYNNFPFPEPDAAQKEKIGQLAEEILRVRELFSDVTLAYLYDKETMPGELKAAHYRLDEAVDQAYGKGFESKEERTAFILEHYARITGELE